ncbi:Thioesterase/thiol ester dehydrase-isomerase [Hypoxylon cercidicola]|nr:Thioesterase/thiol ester dehydrase-isomerase [Hypoxylon cercidicola]
MVRHASIEALVAVKPSPDQGRDAYVNANAFTTREGLRTVFGGALIGQAVSAATATVPDSFRMYSSQSSFLGAVDARKQVVYGVERASDGKTYAARVVRITNGGACVYVAIIAFQDAARPVLRALRYETPMPDLDGMRPEDVDPGAMHALQERFVDRSVPVLAMALEEWPFDWRPAGVEMGDQPTDLRVRIFVRAPPPPLAAGNHLAALAYLSDEFVYGTALATDLQAAGEGFRNLTMGATLTQTVSFHSPRARIDRWLLLERETSWGADGRVVVHQRAWDWGTGTMVYSGTQEALIRLKGPKL